jgi:Rrf2 family protein
MLDLAEHDTGQPVKLRQIAERQDLSDKYLEQIIHLLSQAGFVKSVRGARGGYRLTRPPQDYTVGMILRLSEGSLAPVTCLEDDPNQCPRSAGCATLDVYRRIDKAVADVVDGLTLADLIRRQTEPDQASSSQTEPDPAQHSC